jgi:hypothetical protein
MLAHQADLNQVALYQIAAALAQPDPLVLQGLAQGERFDYGRRQQRQHHRGRDGLGSHDGKAELLQAGAQLGGEPPAAAKPSLLAKRARLAERAETRLVEVVNGTLSECA